MVPNYEVIFGVGALGTVISFILLLIGVIKNIKKLKIISITLITTFIIVFSTGIALGYYYYDNSKDVMSKVSDNELDTKITSGSIDDPVVITEKSFFDDDTYYYSQFSITNNTNVEISKISFHILFTYKGTLGEGGHDEPIFLIDSVIPPNKTVVENYIWKKGNTEKELSISNVKLIKIQTPISYVNIDGEEKRIELDEFKSILSNNK